jgi:hypothetical protein
MNLRSALRTLAFASVCALPLPAGVVTINFTETGGDVVATLSGSLTDASAWTVSSVNYNSINSLFPIAGVTYFWAGGTGTSYNAAVAGSGTWTFGFGSGTPVTPSSVSGDLFTFARAGDSIGLPSNYNFNSPTNLSSTMTFSGATFVSLGITATPVAVTYGGDTIQLTFGGGGGGSSVPDAGPGPALALLLGGLGLRQWHSSRRSRAAA